jgi:hypothetical protein
MTIGSALIIWPTKSQEIQVSRGIFEKLPNFIKKSTVNTAQYVVVAEDHIMHRGVVVIYPDDPANSVHDAC